MAACSCISHQRHPRPPVHSGVWHQHQTLEPPRRAPPWPPCFGPRRSGTALCCAVVRLLGLTTGIRIRRLLAASLSLLARLSLFRLEFRSQPPRTPHAPCRLLSPLTLSHHTRHQATRLPASGTHMPPHPHHHLTTHHPHADIHSRVSSSESDAVTRDKNGSPHSPRPTLSAGMRVGVGTHSPASLTEGPRPSTPQCATRPCPHAYTYPSSASVSV
jgi:hypothetical protein